MRRRNWNQPIIVEHVARLPGREKPARRRRREKRAAEREARGLPAWPKGSWGALWTEDNKPAEQAEGETDGRAEGDERKDVDP